MGMVAFWPGEREPEYNGRKLSEWLLYKQPASESNLANPQIEAIRQIGEDAVPWLLKWARYQSPPWRRRLDRFFGEDRGIERSQAVWFAFRALGPKAADAIPALARMENDPRERHFYGKPLYAMAHMGEHAFPPVLAVLETAHHPDRAAAARIIGETEEWGTNRLRAVPALISCLHGNEYLLAAAAESSLGTLATDRGLPLPQLAKSLSDPGTKGNIDDTVASRTRFVVSQKTPERLRIAATMALGLIGRRAHEAVPALVRTLNDDDEIIQRAATNALQKIAPEALTTAAKGF
jgi:HEAT repeat protein